LKRGSQNEIIKNCPMKNKQKVTSDVSLASTTLCKFNLKRIFYDTLSLMRAENTACGIL
jgi:hypothetical protein